MKKKLKTKKVPRRHLVRALRPEKVHKSRKLYNRKAAKYELQKLF